VTNEERQRIQEIAARVAKLPPVAWVSSLVGDVEFLFALVERLEGRVASLESALAEGLKMAATVSDAQSSDLRGDRARADRKWAEAKAIEAKLRAALSGREAE
jgi:hypothetical protein